MDLTYWIALALASLVAFGVSLALALAGRDLTRMQHRRLLIFMIVVDFVLLVDWHGIAHVPRWVPVADLIFFPLFSMIGIAIGVVPAALLHAITRRLRR